MPCDIYEEKLCLYMMSYYCWECSTCIIIVWGINLNWLISVFGWSSSWIWKTLLFWTKVTNWAGEPKVTTTIFLYPILFVTVSMFPRNPKPEYGGINCPPIGVSACRPLSRFLTHQKRFVNSYINYVSCPSKMRDN